MLLLSCSYIDIGYSDESEKNSGKEIIVIIWHSIAIYTQSFIFHSRFQYTQHNIYEG
jgi:hypothetical protein